MPSRTTRVFTLCYFAVLASVLASSANSQEDYPVKPKLAAASDEAELALNAFQYPEGWNAELWAAEPMLGNPVVFTIDAQGKIWVCESYRQEKGVTDNRGHDSKWLDRDLAAQTVEDRIAYHKELLPDQGLSYTKHDDLIRILEDSDGDGAADKSWIFADHFNDLEMGTGAGVLVNGSDVYYTCIPHLWLLKDMDRDGKSDFRQSLSQGYGVRVAFRGHDSHGLIVGPDGRLYFSIGDRGYSITLPDGKRLHDPDSGAVFRCEMDGSNLEVFATGLRNPQELAFDDYGNLFTGDNNSDSGDKARWVYVAEGGDSGWRMNYQYMPDRGPFNREKIWHPYHTEQPAFIVPPVINISDGPSGLAYYPGTGLSDDYRGRFFLCDFRGASGVSGIRTFRSEPKGAFFELVADEQPIWRILATDVDFGPDGHIYVSDWINGWDGVNKGRIYRFSDPEFVDTDVVREVQSLIANGLEETPIFRTVELMNHPDRRIRQLAQFELVNRKLDAELKTLALSESPLMGRLHAIWGIGQRIRSGQNKALETTVIELLDSEQGELRAQAARLVGDLKIEVDVKKLTDLLTDTNQRVRYFAAISLGKFKAPSAVFPLLEMLRTNDGEDPALRHAAIMGLAGQDDVVQSDHLAPIDKEKIDLVQFARQSDSVEVRRALAVVFRRWKSRRIQEFFEFEQSPLVLDEVARAIYDVPISPAMSTLASQLDHVENDSEHLIRRALGAANFLGGQENANRVSALATNTNAPTSMRREALKILGQWANPTSRDRVIGCWREIGPRPAAIAVAAITPVFENLINDEATRDSGIETAKALKLEAAEVPLQNLFANPQTNEETRMKVLLALSTLKASNLKELCQLAAKDPSAKLRMASREISIDQGYNQVSELKFWNQALNSDDLRERQHGYELFENNRLLDNEEVLEILEQQLTRLNNGEIPETDRLDLVTAAGSWIEKGQVDSLLKRYFASFDQNDPVSKNRDTLVGGDAENGSEIFWNRTSVYCQRCHQIGDRGGAVGPNLSDIAIQKDRNYLLESIVDPNKTIAENFETTVILDIDGNTIAGIVQKETDEFVQLIDAEAKVITIQKDNIEGRRKGESAMPIDLVKHLSKKDIRDLVEFLASQKTAPKKDVVIPEGHK